MGLLQTDNKRKRLRDEIAELRSELSQTRGNVELKRERDNLEKQVEGLGLKLSQETEAHEKKLREVEHKVGLQQQKTQQDAEIEKKRQQAETAAAVKEAELQVREGNLSAATERLEEQMTFERRENDKHRDEINGLFQQIVGMLPKHNINEHVFSGEADGKTKRAAIESGN